MAPPRKRLCTNLEDYPRLRAAVLSANSGRSSRASWTSDGASTYSLLTPPDSPHIVVRPLDIIKVEDEDEDEDDADVKESLPFASDADCPPTSSDESSDGSVASQDNDIDVHYTDSEVEMKATTQHPFSFSSTEEEEESGEDDESGSEEGYGSEGEEYGDVEDEYENWGVDEKDDYEGEDEDEDNEEGYIVHPNWVAVRAQHFPQYAGGMSGFAMFAQQEVANLSSAGGIIASPHVLYGVTNAQYFVF
ncbi:uncharacterized protein STEHIDRAFT_135833 [Stereum hirsutum FP-91666 SS1]|uniref:Uncharacterized protein n=1 Tax=Stereum hirsutum (strain FP-91666) TaxID=721885 RepID=R7RWY8_STEHR|nr:uncharacterized protein STEHIDRAFT_135833 [Stereum hirsutum FP-91666 SS1]EIM79328.1 hypothetical protein STEHIDRAFT_135833 [Stereum hirsutum FP-91666 SS1]